MSTKISVFVFFPAPFHLRSVPPSRTKARRRCEKGNGGERGLFGGGWGCAMCTWWWLGCLQLRLYHICFHFNSDRLASDLHLKPSVKGGEKVNSCFLLESSYCLVLKSNLLMDKHIIVKLNICTEIQKYNQNFFSKLGNLLFCKLLSVLFHWNALVEWKTHKERVQTYIGSQPNTSGTYFQY